jgi:hypothetical protein
MLRPLLFEHAPFFSASNCTLPCRYEREATQRKMAHNRKVLRLQSKASVLRRDAKNDERMLKEEHILLSASQEKLKELDLQRWVLKQAV